MAHVQPFAASAAMLRSRAPRAPDYEREARALRVLAAELASSPDTLLQKLVDTALELCGAESAGISILEAGEGGAIFRWHATAGLFTEYAGGGMPRDRSPCGHVIDSDDVLLFLEPALQFPELAAVRVPILENLLVPFHFEGRPVGTLWAVFHTPGRQFDAEHARLLTSLSRFASAGYQLNTALHRAQDANRAKSEFIATVSHELRTPLTGVIGYADLLRSGAAGRMTERHDKMIERIQRSSWHLVNIIDEILTFSRVEANHEELNIDRTDISSIAREVVSIMQPTSAGRVTLQLHGAESPIYCQTDPGKVRQILLNLIGNAVKYSREGSVDVVLEQADATIAIHVRDSGPGIAAEHQDRIFEPFTQVDSSSTRATGGIGLGLAICRRLAGLLDGDVILQSVPGEGSTFTLRLPA